MENMHILCSKLPDKATLPRQLELPRYLKKGAIRNGLPVYSCILPGGTHRHAFRDFKMPRQFGNENEGE